MPEDPSEISKPPRLCQGIAIEYKVFARPLVVDGSHVTALYVLATCWFNFVNASVYLERGPTSLTFRLMEQESHFTSDTTCYCIAAWPMESVEWLEKPPPRVVITDHYGEHTVQVAPW